MVSKTPFYQQSSSIHHRKEELAIPNPISKNINNSVHKPRAMLYCPLLAATAVAKGSSKVGPVKKVSSQQIAVR